MKQPAVYIMEKAKNGTIYTGVTSSLLHRVYQHKSATFDGFTKVHDCKLFVYYELHASMPDAICRENKLKATLGRRKQL